MGQDGRLKENCSSVTRTHIVLNHAATSTVASAMHLPVSPALNLHLSEENMPCVLRSSSKACGR